MNQDFKSRVLAYDTQVPRYTSYPTAPHFKPVAGADGYAAWLAALPDEATLSLYLHVPFCPKMCLYCGCHTKITQRYAPVEDYLYLMMREIAIVAAHTKPGQRVTHIHFGGGSPSMMMPQDFTRIMDTLRAHFMFSDHVEIAMEMDPRGITSTHIEAYAAAGLNRASIGVQDFDDHVLAAVNRQQPYGLTEKLVGMLRDHGIADINFDLLYGLPHQTCATINATLDRVLDLMPARLAVFGYAHVPWMKKHMTLIDETALPDKSLRYDLFETAAARLGYAGYTLIGIDHFAKKEDPLTRARDAGMLRRNFQGYTTDTSDYLIGFGASSIGKFPDGYVQNAVAAPVYRDHILAGRLPADKLCVLDDDDRLRGALIERLMCDLHVDVAAICARFNQPVSIFESAFAALHPLIHDGLVTVRDMHIVIDSRAPQIARLTAAAFDSYLPHVTRTAAPRHARAI